MLQNDAVEAEGYTVQDLCGFLGVSPTTFKDWSKAGVAPRRDVKGGRWDRVSAEELARWVQQRDRDRKQVAKPWLRHPLKPYSWLTEAEKATRRNPFAKAVDEAMAPQEPADIDAEAEALALIIHRKALASGQDLDEETLGKVVAAVVRRAKDLKPDLRVVEGGRQ